MTRWAVCGMDDGILRWEPTRQAAADWFRRVQGAARIDLLRKYGAGCYEYGLPEDPDSYFQPSAVIIRNDCLDFEGFDPEQPALYPIASQPFDRVERNQDPAAEPDGAVQMWPSYEFLMSFSRHYTEETS